MKKTLLASAVVVLVGATGSVWAGSPGDYNDSKDKQPTTNIDVDIDVNDVLSHNKLIDKSTNKNSGESHSNGDRSVALNNGSVASFSNAFNKTHIAAVSKLNGSVSNIGVGNIGNWVQNSSNANGGGAGGGAGGSGDADSSAQSGSGGGGRHDGNDYAKNGNDDKGGGDVSNGVGNISSAANGGAGGGAVGGNGGTNRVSAGTFNMSSNMTHVGQSAAGIMVISQNSGFASLAQQSVNVQSNLSVK